MNFVTTLSWDDQVTLLERLGLKPKQGRDVWKLLDDNLKGQAQGPVKFLKALFSEQVADLLLLLGFKCHGSTNERTQTILEIWSGVRL